MKPFLWSLCILTSTAPLVLAQDAPAGGQEGPPSAATPSEQGSDSSGSGRSGASWFRPDRMAVRPADADRNGDIDGAEWEAYVASLSDGEGSIDERRLLSEIIIHEIDQEEDGRLTIEDLFLLHEGFDQNADGLIESTELPQPFVFGASAGSSGGSSGRGGSRRRWGKLYLGSHCIRPADTNRDGQITEEEWGLLIDGLELDADGGIPEETFQAWIDLAMADIPEDRNAFSPTTYLVTIEASLDADKNGSIDVADVQGFFDGFDRDSDGILARAEWSFASQFRAPEPEKPKTPDDSELVQAPEASAPESVPAYTRLRADREPLMPWQRNLDDALALVEQTGKPLLICVNMDGERASESLARSRYRDPEFAALAKGFIPVLASPDRRNTRDYDDRGQRIPDDKFGRITNSEHIEIEPKLFKRYFDDRRVAPRHVGVDKDGNILFDIYLVNDLSVVDKALREHGIQGSEPRDPATMDELELLDSPDALHREHLEELFLAGQERTRVRLASLALSVVRETQHPELLRMALHDPARRVRLQAIWSIIQHPTAVPLDLYVPAFQSCQDEPGAASALVGALRQVAEIAEDDDVRQRADRLQRTYEGLRHSSDILDVERWRVAMSWAAPLEGGDNATSDELIKRLAELEKRLTKNPAERESQLAFAALSMRYARHLIRAGRNPSFMLEDVLLAAKRATSEAEPDGRALAYLAWASYMLSDMEAAALHAEQAAPLLVPWAGTPYAAKLLEILADTRTRAIYAAMAEGSEWPSAWVSDIRSSYEILLDHPSGTEEHAIAYVDFLNAVEVAGPQVDILRRSLARNPKSGRLHAYLRGQVLRDRGAEELQKTYATLKVRPDLRSTFQWYEGYAQLVAAERYVQNRDDDAALSAYDKSVALFRASTVDQPDFDKSANHYVCLALSGAARIHADSYDFASAVAALEEGIRANPDSAAWSDGLGNTPKGNASYLHRELIRAGRRDQATRLAAFLTENGVELEG